MPSWFKPLVNRVIKEGKDISKLPVNEGGAFAERQIIHSKKLGENHRVNVIQDVDNQTIRVEYQSADNMGGVDDAVHLEYKAAEEIEPMLAQHMNPKDPKGPWLPNKAQKTKPTFSAEEAWPHGTTGDYKDITMEGSNVVNKVDDLYSDTSALKQFATGKNLTKQELKIAKQKQKRVNEINNDLGEQDQLLPDPPDPDFASGGRVPFKKGKFVLSKLDEGIAYLKKKFGQDIIKKGELSKPMAEKTGLRRAHADFIEREKAAKLKEEQIKEFTGDELSKWDDLGGSKADPFSPDFDFRAEADLVAEIELAKKAKAAAKKLKTWEDPDKLRAAVDDIFSSGDYKMDAQMASEALVENNPKAFGNKLYDDLDQRTQMEIYGAVVNVVQKDLAKMLQLKRASKPTKTLEGIKKTGTIDISDPNIAEEFTKFMKETDPKGHAKIQKVVDDVNQKLELKRFKTKYRKPNASGGLAGMLGE